MDEISQVNGINASPAVPTIERPSESRERIRQRVLTEAQRSFTGLSDHELEAVVDRVMNRIWGDGLRVTSFVPVIAMRHIRSELSETY